MKMAKTYDSTAGQWETLKNLKLNLLTDINGY